MIDRTLCIIIPTHGHWDYASRAVETSIANTKTVIPHVVIIDDASPDWSDAWLHKISHDRAVTGHHFNKNGGLTRSWNHGLDYARDYSYDYTCVTNSDVLFTPGWDEPLIAALESGYSLVGPVTNAPGTEKQQNVLWYASGYQRENVLRLDGDDELAALAKFLKETRSGQVISSNINGFCMMAKTETWLDNAFDEDHVFNPCNEFNSKGERNPTPLMTLQEYELQRRWQAKGLKTGFCPNSYVWHYRAVSRGDQYKKEGWYRMISVES